MRGQFHSDNCLVNGCCGAAKGLGAGASGAAAAAGAGVGVGVGVEAVAAAEVAGVAAEAVAVQRSHFAVNRSALMNSSKHARSGMEG